VGSKNGPVSKSGQNSWRSMKSCGGRCRCSDLACGLAHRPHRLKKKKELLTLGIQAAEQALPRIREKLLR